MVAYLEKWRNIDELLEQVTFVAVARTGFAQESIYPVRWVQAPILDISSTALRKTFAKGERPNFLMPDAVIDYILEKHLYESEQ